MNAKIQSFMIGWTVVPIFFGIKIIRRMGSRQEPSIHNHIEERRKL